MLCYAIYVLSQCPNFSYNVVLYARPLVRKNSADSLSLCSCQEGRYQEPFEQVKDPLPPHCDRRSIKLNHFEFLCTGGAYNVPYSLLFISDKFCNGWGGGSSPSKVIKFLYSPAPPPPTVWALVLPMIYPFKVTRGLMCIKQPMHLGFIQPCA